MGQMFFNIIFDKVPIKEIHGLIFVIASH